MKAERQARVCLHSPGGATNLRKFKIKKKKIMRQTTTVADLRHKPPNYISFDLYYISSARNSSNRIRQVAKMFNFCA